MKPLLTLWLCVIAGGSLFAQTAETVETIAIIETETALLKNTVTVDVGPTLYSLLFTVISAQTGGAKVFDIAAQYERHITKKASAAGRLEYGVMDMFDDEFVHAVSAEGHGRYYPGTGVFFLDGMLGYAAVFLDASKSDTVQSSVTHYFKFGGKVGWSIDFGKPGGFILEPGIGYYGVAGPDVKVYNYDVDEPLNNMLNLLYENIVKALFLSGPRFSLGLGYRF